jgi:hypothetical protein
MSHFITSKDIPADGEHLKKGQLTLPITVCGVVAVVGIMMSTYLLFFHDHTAANVPADTVQGRFAYSWLFAFIFFISLSLGGAFWMILHHLTNSGWGVSVRRIMEHLAGVFPWMAILAIPFLFPQVQKHLFEWMNMHRDAMGEDASLYGYAKNALHHSHNPFDHLLYLKVFYMNLPFWLGRMISYFVILGGGILWMRKLSTDQDNDTKPSVKRLIFSRKLAAGLMLIFSLVITFLALDLAMALDFKWFSTMFGVYYFAGCILSGMACLILTTLLLNKAGYLQTVVSQEHYHIMGKLTFAFVIFWGYINFDQFFLIWYANITEETSFFILRNTGNWNTANIALVLGHFVLPFLFLIRSDVKKTPTLMIPITIFLLVLHALDHYVLIMPERGPSLTLHSEAGPSLYPSGSVVWLDILAFVTIGAFFIFFYLRALTKTSLYPHRDPRILESANLLN